jgi:hypothetical protein
LQRLDDALTRQRFVVGHENRATDRHYLSSA